MEQYVEAIAELTREDGHTSISAIADHAGVSRPAASRSVRDLADKHLVEHRAYGHVSLTDAGRSLAGRLAERHDLLQAFLRNVLGYPPEPADEEACHLEHLVGDAFAQQLGALSTFFAEDPELAARWRTYRDEAGKNPQA